MNDNRDWLKELHNDPEQLNPAEPNLHSDDEGLMFFVGCCIALLVLAVAFVVMLIL